MPRRGRARGLASSLAAAALIAGCSPGLAPPSAPPPAPPGPAQPGPGGPESVRPAPPALVSYSAIQAEQGREVFQNVCSACHGVAEFRGQMFRMTWMARPIGHFFQLIEATMPQDTPGSLTPPEYAAVVAYILQLNGHPAGSVELPADVRALEGLAWPR